MNVNFLRRLSQGLPNTTMSASKYKLVFSTPFESTQKILDHLFETFPNELGNIGEYDQCAFRTRGLGSSILFYYSAPPSDCFTGTGQFRPSLKANPVIGTGGKLEHVEEDRIEILINHGGPEQVRKTIEELKKVFLHVQSVNLALKVFSRFTLTRRFLMMFTNLKTSDVWWAIGVLQARSPIHITVLLSQVPRLLLNVAMRTGYNIRYHIKILAVTLHAFPPTIIILNSCKSLTPRPQRPQCSLSSLFYPYSL